MTPRLSKFVLTTHITFSVGWLGSVAVFIALAITGIESQDMLLARASYLAMEVSSWYIIVPFCIASLLTGIIQSIGTKWGLFKHYWITVKLILTLAATVLLLLHLRPIGLMAKMAAGAKFPPAQMPGLQIRLIADSTAGFLALLTILTISVYKPWGKIIAGKQLWRKYMLTGLGILILFFIVLHLLGVGMHGH